MYLKTHVRTEYKVHSTKYLELNPRVTLGACAESQSPSKHVVDALPCRIPAWHRYQVLVAYLLAVALALPNTYGDGLTDWDMSSMYGKLGIVIAAAWSGSITTGLVGELPSNFEHFAVRYAARAPRTLLIKLISRINKSCAYTRRQPSPTKGLSQPLTD